MSKTIPEIKNLTRARNAEHYWLQEALLRSITQEFATKYQLLSLYTAFVKAFEKEDAVFRNTQTFEDTKPLEKKAAERNRLFLHIRLIIRGMKLGLDDAAVKAAEVLSFITKPYGMAAAKPDTEGSAQIIDLVKKLESSEYKQHVETLGLTQAVAALKKANNEFETLYSHRANEKRVRSSTEGLKKLRSKADKAFLDISKAINALYAVNALVEKDAEKEAEIGAVIDAMNAVILQFAETLSRRQIGRKSLVLQNTTPAEEGEIGSNDAENSVADTEIESTEAGNNPVETE
jgi:hypothetical protein